MANALTTQTGEDLYATLIGGGTPTPFYGTLILGRGNDEPTAGDRTTSINKRVPIGPTASPVLDDGDSRNPGRGAGVFTWTFDISAPSTPWLATNVALATNPLVDNEELAVHAADDVLGDPYRRVIVWVNLGNSESTIYHLNVVDPVQAAKLRSTGARSDVLYGGQGSTTLRIGEVYSEALAGESVPLRGRLYGEDGQAIIPGDVKRVTRRISVYDAGRNQWVATGTKAVDRCVFRLANSESSAVFPYRGGFNFSASTPGRETLAGKQLKVVYRLELCDGVAKVLTQPARGSRSRCS